MNSVNSFKDIGKIYKLQESGYKQVKRGEIYYVERAGYSSGSEQAGGRPALIVGNDVGNEKSPVALAVYLTTSQKPPMPTHVAVECKEPSTALCEQVFTIDKSRLGDYIKAATPEEMQKVDKALAISLALIGCEPEKPAVLDTDDDLLKNAVSRVNEISGLIEHARYIDRNIEQVKECAAISFVGSTVTTLEDVLSAESIAYIRDAALGEISNERESVRKELTRILQQEKKLEQVKEASDVGITSMKPKRTNRKIDDAIAMQMLLDGKTQKEMRERFGVSAGTMSIWVKNHKPVDEGVERTQCETCNYHATEKGKTVCRYEKITGKKRDCKVEECRKWREV